MDLQNDESQELMSERDRLTKQISMTIEIITPKLAQTYLMKNLGNPNIRNRKITQRTVNNYVKDILGKRWRVGAPIIFDTNDTMIDGQTRCTGVVKSNKSIISVVLRGVDPDIFDSLDCGKKRTLKDGLTTLVINGKGLVNSGVVSSAINIIHSLSKNHVSIDKNRGMLTNSEIIEIVKKDFNYYDEPFSGGKSSKIIKWRKNINKAIPESVFASFYYTYKKQHGSIVDNFLTTITSNGVNTPLVVREFRDMIIYNKGKKSDEKGYLSPVAVYRLIDVLFKYNLNNNLITRKHISHTDLIKING